MNRFHRLSDDELMSISLYLDEKSLNFFILTCSSIYVSCQQDEIWFSLLNNIFPSYIPLSGNKNSNNEDDINTNERERDQKSCSNYLIKKSSKYKIRNFKNKLFNISSLGKLKTFRSRFLHRSVIASNGEHFIFGGVTSSDNTESGNFSDVWKLIVDEVSKEIRLSKVNIIQPQGIFQI